MQRNLKNKTKPKISSDTAEVVQKTTEKLEVPTAFDVAKLHAIIDEVNELNYRKMRPFNFILTGILSDSFILNSDSIPLIGYLKEAIYLNLLPVLLDPKSRKIVEKVLSGNYSNQDVIAFNRLNAATIPEMKKYLDYGFIAFVQIPMIFALYFINKKIATHYFSADISLEEKSHFNTNTSKTKINDSIYQLTQTSKNLRTVSNKIANYSFLLFLALLAMIRLTGTANEGIIYLLDSWLLLFSLFAKVEGYLTQRSLAKTEANLEKLEKQLNSITEKVNLTWSLDKGSYLKSSPCILNISHCNDVEYESDKLEKNIFLKIMRNILLKYDFRILCFNSYRGIIVTRERTLNDLELKNINKDLEDALTREAKQEKNILCILDHLNKISDRFSSKFCFWDYYLEDNYFALNIFQLNKNEVSLMKNKLVQYLGNESVQFSEESGYLKILGVTHADTLATAFNAIVAETSASHSDAHTQKQEQKTSEELPRIKTKSRPNHATLFAVLPVPEVMPSESLSSRYPMYSPNFPANTHFSRYSVPNQGIMTTKINGKTLYDRFFEVVKTGQMSGRGNHIARLQQPKRKVGLFSTTAIFATHKLIIPELDMRIYGEMKAEAKNEYDTDFNTVVPTHKWANR